MASFMDSRSVFEQRLRSCDVPEDAIAKLVAVGVTSLSKLAFCTSYSPSMVDDTPLVSFFKQTIDPNAELSPGVLSSLRRAFFEAHTFMLSDLKSKIDKKEDEAPRKVPQAERNARLQAQRNRLQGVEVSGPLEPSDALIDLVSQQREDELLRYIELEQCTCRESEVRSSRTSKSNKADLSTDFLIRQAMQRRALAYDQLDIFPYSYLESWATFLFNLINRAPVKIEGAAFNKVTMPQILEADRQAFALTSDRCRAGLHSVIPGSYPATAAFDLAKSDPLVLSLLQPLPAVRERQQGYARDVKSLRTNDGQKGSSKGPSGKGSGKGKSKGKRQMAPKELIGLNLRTKGGDPICYSYNLNGCSLAGNGEKCPKGFHQCAKCLGMHAKKDCPVP